MSTRLVILSIYILGLLVSAALWLHLLQENAQDVAGLGKKLAAVYTVPFGVMLGATFARSSSPAQPGVPLATAVIAVVLVVLWNAVVVTAMILAQEPNSILKTVTDGVDQAATAANFLTGAALAYVFASAKAQS